MRIRVVICLFVAAQCVFALFVSVYVCVCLGVSGCLYLCLCLHIKPSARGNCVRAVLEDSNDMGVSECGLDR